MNRDFLDLYQQELRHIREHAAEFAAAYPKIANRLFLEKNTLDQCRDPFVERLLEGFAFLTARTQLKLEAEFPRFTQGILETVYPDYLAPGPSAAVVEFSIRNEERALLDGVRIPRQTSMESRSVGGDTAACTFLTAHEVTLHGWEISAAEYLTTGVGGLNLGSRVSSRRDVRAAVRLRLRVCTRDPAPVSKVNCDRLNLFIHDSDTDHMPARLLEHILADGLGVVVQEPGDHAHTRSSFLPASALSQGGFSAEEALLPRSPFGFDGHRILREHFLIRQRGLFLDIQGISGGLGRITSQEVDIIIPLGSRRGGMENFVSDGVFRLHCTPVINLFPRRSNRAEVRRGCAEHQIIIDRHRMADYEIYSIHALHGYRRGEVGKMEFRPFYLQPSASRGESAFYTVNRQRRILTQNEKRAALPYAGTEVFVSLVTPDAAPHPADLDQIEADCMVSNRHLPLNIETGKGHTDFELSGSFPVTAVRCLHKPTKPVPSHAEGSHAWRSISHLSLNYLSIAGNGADALRQLLRLYALHGQDSHIEGLVRVSSRASVERCPGPGPACFVRGTEIGVFLNEEHFAGMGSFLLLSALEQFLARQATINCYTRLSMYRLPEEKKEVYQWPVRMGSLSTV